MLKTVAFAAAAFVVATPIHAQDKTSEIESIFSFATSTAPGCALGVSQHGKVIVNRAFGLGDVERGIPLSTSSTFDIGSTQKQFAAAALLILAEEGRLALSDDVRKYMPELHDYGHTVTLDHLLTHTSGVRDWQGLQGMSGSNSDAITLILRQHSLNFRPGDEWSYSNSGFVLLKEIVARASGMSYADFTRKRLFDPLGMKSTSYVADALSGGANVALAYVKDGSGWKQSMLLGNARGGGTLLSTPHDLLIWNDALTNGRLGASVTAKLHEPAKLNNGRTLIYARGLFVDKYRGLDRVWHSGGAAGYNAWLGRFPKQGLSIALLCNLDNVGATVTAHRVADLFLPPATMAADSSAAAPDVSSRAGLFLNERTGEPLTLIVNNGELRIPGGRAALVAMSADRFHIPGGDLFFRSQDEFVMTFVSSDEVEIKSMEGITSRYRRAQPFTPAQADLQSYLGRYETGELGVIYEIKTTPESVVVHRVGSSGQGSDLKAIATDTFQRSATWLRFQRDAAGRVIAFEFNNPLLRRLKVTKVVE